jgi:hypothetical protein
MITAIWTRVMKLSLVGSVLTLLDSCLAVGEVRLLVGCK